MLLMASTDKLFSCLFNNLEKKNTTQIINLQDHSLDSLSQIIQLKQKHPTVPHPASVNTALQKEEEQARHQSAQSTDEYINANFWPLELN